MAEWDGEGGVRQIGMDRILQLSPLEVSHCRELTLSDRQRDRVVLGACHHSVQQLPQLFRCTQPSSQPPAMWDESAEGSREMRKVLLQMQSLDAGVQV